MGLIAGLALGLRGVAFHRAASAGFLLALSPTLAPGAFVCAGWLLARPAIAPAPQPLRDADVEGRIVSVPERLGDRIQFRLRAADGELFDAFAPPAPWPLALGDRIRMRAHLRSPPRVRNPGGRDTAGRLAASGVLLQAFAVGPTIRTGPPSAVAWLERVRERFAESANRALPPREAALVRAIATGDRSELDPATTTSFSRSGLAHILAVSGLHLVVVAFGLERLLRSALLRIDAVAMRIDARRAAAAALLPATAVYALATGAGVPVLRAGIALGVAAAGALLSRETTAANVLALAALVLLGSEPAAALDPSLQLTFAAVCGLVLWASPFRRAIPISVARRGTWRARLLEPLLGGACATLAASIATAPVLAFHFRQLPLLGVLANIVGVPVGSALTAVATLAALVAAASPPLATPLLYTARPLATALLALSDAASPRWGILAVASPGLAFAGGFAAAAIAAGHLRGRARIAAALAAVGCLLVPGPLRAHLARARGGLEVWFLSVGQGDAALLRLPDGSAVLVDGGGSSSGGADPGARDIVPLLRDLGIRRLAAVFVSHPHPDHVLGLAAVTEAFETDRVFSNGDDGEGSARDVLRALRPTVLLPGSFWQRAGVRFDVLGGDRERLAANDASLVLRVSYGATSFLFPGDVEGDGEAAALARGGLHADVVKIPHHGSRTSSGPAFAAAVRPRLAVVSVGIANRFGFPDEEAVARWREVGARVLRTDEGAIRLLSDGRRVLRVPAAAALDPLAIRVERTHACGVRIEDMDLMEIAERLRRLIPEGEPPVGYLRGRSYFRDVLAHDLGCSELEAEALVDTLEINGYLKFKGDPSVRSSADSGWYVDPHVP